MKKKDIVIAGVIGWVAGPFTFVYLGKKKPLRALIELLAILAIGYATSVWVLVPFVLGYAMFGALAAQKYNFELKRTQSQSGN
ncbi:MAG: hypothetical protein PWP71_1457 [Clostridia bacterium]|nr:hypothetical protein [Clostridia bacterium]